MQLRPWALTALLALLSPALADTPLGTVSDDSSGAASATTTPTTAAASANPAATTGSGDGNPFGITGPCFPKLANGTIDKRAPCRAVEIIAFKCLLKAHGAGDDNSNDNPDDQSKLNGLGALNATVDQECFCKSGQIGSGWWENAEGCLNCRRLHGEREQYFPKRLVPSLSREYCGIATPTTDLANYFAKWYERHQSDSAAASETPTDTLGTQTAISAYFTSTAVSSAAATGSGSSSASSSSAAPTPASSGAAAPGITAAPIGGVVVAGVIGLAALL